MSTVTFDQLGLFRYSQDPMVDAGVLLQDLLFHRHIIRNNRNRILTFLRNQMGVLINLTEADQSLIESVRANLVSVEMFLFTEDLFVPCEEVSKRRAKVGKLRRFRTRRVAHEE